MTIDEAIREEQTLYDIVKNTYKKLGIKDCLKIMEGHKQYIEWLEELKALREKNETLKALYVDARKEGNSLLKHERNKAIDDFIEKVELKYLGVHPDELYEKYYPREICKQIKELAE